MNYVCIFLIYTNDTYFTEFPWGLSALIYVKHLEKKCQAYSKCLIALVSAQQIPQMFYSEESSFSLIGALGPHEMMRSKECVKVAD